MCVQTTHDAKIIKLADFQDLYAVRSLELVGVCAFDALPPLIPCRAKSRLPAEPKSVLVCAFPYQLPPASYVERNLSRYAVVPDYHLVAGKMLDDIAVALTVRFPGVYQSFVDNSPIPEVTAAVLAGLGVRGKNGLLLTQRYGSYVFIGTIVTDRLYRPTPAAVTSCIGCGRCIAACPGGAITPDGIHRDRCLSHITQKKGELTGEEKELIRQGGLVWGCDRCQEVCPMNCDTDTTPIPAFLEDPVAHVLPEQVDKLCTERAFGFRGPHVLHRNFEILSDLPEPKPEGRPQQKD